MARPYIRTQQLREAAKAEGRLNYDPGVPCAHGHTSNRRTKDGKCLACVGERIKRYCTRRPERRRATAAKSRHKYREERNEWERQWTKTPPGKANRNGKSALRRAARRAARCACCTPAQIRTVYRAAALLSLEVDHVIRLADGGAHCIKNLQLLTTAEHRLKSAEENRRRFRPVA